MSQSWSLDLVVEIASPDRDTTFLDRMLGGIVGRLGGVAALNHKVRNESVEGCAIVGTGCAKRKEVLGCLRHQVAEDFDFDVTVGSVYLTRISIHVAAIGS